MFTNQGVPSQIHGLAAIVMSQAAKLRAKGELSPSSFDAQIRRIEREELKPLGLSVAVRFLEGGQTRFLLKSSRTGKVCEVLDFSKNGSLSKDLESGSSSSAAG